MGQEDSLKILAVSGGSGRGLEEAEDLLDRYSHALVLGPLSTPYLFRLELLLKIVRRRNTIVIPSSLDDPAVYVRLRKAGARICRGSEDLGDAILICVERGEAPWKSLARVSGIESLALVLSQDLDTSGLDDLHGARPGHELVYISYGISQPLGIRLGRWISAGIPPFSDTILIVERSWKELEIALRLAKRHGAVIGIGIRIRRPPRASGRPYSVF